MLPWLVYSKVDRNFSSDSSDVKPYLGNHILFRENCFCMLCLNEGRSSTTKFKEMYYKSNRKFFQKHTDTTIHKDTIENCRTDYILKKWRWCISVFMKKLTFFGSFPWILLKSDLCPNLTYKNMFLRKEMWLLRYRFTTEGSDKKFRSTLE